MTVRLPKFSSQQVRILIACLTLSALYSFASTTKAFAGSIYLSPGAKSVAAGSVFSVSVRENSGGDAVNAVQANLSYPTDKLDYVGISAGGSAFSIDASSGGGGGGVSISRGVVGNGVTGDRLIATVSFRAKGSGTASVGVSGQLVRGADQANVFSGGAGGTYTIGGSGTSSSSSSKKPTPVVQPLTISNVNVANVSYQTATVTWTTNRSASSEVNFGLTDKYGLTADSKNVSTSHSVVLTSQLLTPGGTYHFQVKSMASDGVIAQGTDQTFHTTGIPVVITVTDEHNTPVTSSLVKLVTPQETLTQTTDANGKATFTNVPPTQVTVITDVKGVQTASTIKVATPSEQELKNPTLTPQPFRVMVKGMSTTNSLSSSSWALYTLVGGLIAIVCAAVIFLLAKRRSSPTISLHDVPPPPTPTQPETN